MDETARAELADQLWEAIPFAASPDNTITLPAPLVMRILQLLRKGYVDA